MKLLPAPYVPGKTELERFDNAMRQVLSVSKEELLKREQREQDKKKREEKTRTEEVVVRFTLLRCAVRRERRAGIHNLSSLF